MFRVYITNLAAYNEGELKGKWIELPLSREELKKEIESILRPGDEEIFITDYENSYDYSVHEYDNLSDLNTFAERLESLDVEPFIVRACFDIFVTPEEVLEKLEAMDYITFYLGDSWNHDDDLGAEVVAQGLFGIEIPEQLGCYLDYEAIGRDYRLSTSGDYYQDDDNSWYYVEIIG